MIAARLWGYACDNSANFLEQEYEMKAYTTEVWIVPANTQPLWPNGMSFLDTHLKYKVYYDQRQYSTRPLYIAFRVNGEVDSIHRVMGVDYETAPITYVPELANLSEEWPKQPYTIWRLGDCTSLPSLIKTGGRLGLVRVSCDVDILLTSKTEREIIDRMNKRREQGK